jgi:methylmalonyl-CoA mutase
LQQQTKKNMFEQFDSVSKATWKAQIEKDLKGKPYEDLIWKLNEDLSFEPFYQREDLANANSPLSAKDSNDWDICEWIDNDNHKLANEIALEALAGGANALTFAIDRGVSAAELADLLKDIELPYIATHFFYTGKKLSMAQKKLEHFYHLAKAKGYDTNSLRGSLQVASLVSEPNWDKVKTLVEWTKVHLPSFKVLTINGAEFHTSDADVSEMLAKTIQRGVEALDELTARGISLFDANQAIIFHISIGKSYFLNISKIRALKLLWLNVLKAYGLQTIDNPTIIASFSTQDFDDNPNTNMIRSTTMALSAAIGGVDTLSVLASEKRGETAFARRIARNVQHLLKMESYIDRVADPAAGAYYIEQMTNDIAKQSWEMFKKY